MHYTRSYVGLHGARKRQVACRDCLKYLGRRKYDQVLRDFRATLRSNPSRWNIRFLENCLSIGGIQGYPARAFTLYALQTRNQ